MLTDRGYIALIGTLGSAFWSALVFYPLLILLFLFSFLFVASYIGLFHRESGSVGPSTFTVSRKVSSETVFRGQELNLNLDLAYSGFSRFAVKITCEIPESFKIVKSPEEGATIMYQGRKLGLSYLLRAVEFGKHEVGEIRVRLEDTLDLCYHEVVLGGATTVTVLPSPEILSRILEYRANITDMSMLAVPRKADPLGDEFREIRQYVPGDSHRRISWRTVARDPEGELYVKEVERMQLDDVVCLVDAGEAMYTGPRGRRCIDLVLDAVASLSKITIESGHRFNLKIWNSQRETSLFHGHGQTHSGRILHALSTIQPSKARSDVSDALRDLYPVLKRGSLILVVSRLTEETPSSLDKLVVEADARGHRLKFAIPAAWEFFDRRDVKWSSVVHSYIVEEERTRLRALETATSVGWGSVMVGGPQSFAQQLLKTYLSASGEKKKGA